jgi:hypothetical protein
LYDAFTGEPVDREATEMLERVLQEWIQHDCPAEYEAWAGMREGLYHLVIDRDAGTVSLTMVPTVSRWADIAAASGTSVLTSATSKADPPVAPSTSAAAPTSSPSAAPASYLTIPEHFSPTLSGTPWQFVPRRPGPPVDA